MPRLLKQFIYGSIYLFIVGVLGLGIYNHYFVSTPSCSDGIKNQQESDIDCGGPHCLQCELKHLTLKIDKPTFFDAGQFKTTAVVKITDPSFDYGSRNFNYEFQVINKLGGAIATRPGLSGTSYISVGESKYLVVPAIDIDPRDVGRVVINIPNPTWELKENLPHYSLSFESLKLSINNKSPQVSGMLNNSSASIYDTISVIGVLFDKSGNPISASTTELNNIQTFSKTPFTIFYPAMNNVSGIDTNSLSNKWFSYEVSR